MQKHHSCINTRAIIEYFQEHHPEDLDRLLEGLGPEIDSLPNPREFLMEINNWVSSPVVIRMFANAREIARNDRIAFEIGFQSAARKRLGYVQRIIMFAHKNPRRTLKRVQAINDKFNRNKAVEVVAATRDRAVVRLRWFRDIPAIVDFCLFNQGIYSGIPTIWDLPPARVLETKCFFKGDDCCEYHFKWERKPRWREAILRWSMPWSLLKTTINELEQDKALLEMKFNEIHRLYRRLEHSERRYRGLVENAHEGIWIIAPTGAISFANPRMREIIGEERLEGRHFAEFFEHRNLGVLEEVLARNRQGEVVQEELELSSPRRGQVAVSMSSVPLQENGQFLGAFAMFNDISDKKKLEKHILQQQKMEAVGTLAGGIAHNFNNLLMNVMGLTGLILANSSPGAPGYEDLKQIEQEVLKGSALTKQLLSFGRGGQFSPHPLNINLVLDRIARLFTRTRHDLVISKNLAPGLPAVAADQGQMEQVILNLLVNAWQAMAGKGEIVLATEVVELPENCCETPGRPAGFYVHLTVADSGVGMDEATATRIFEPFFSTKEIGQGTGLGLATAYAIIKNHGGIIKVDSRPGQGATFHLYLPVTDQPVPAEPEASHRFVQGAGTILLVDDEDGIRSVGKRILEQLGYEILLAENGPRALEIYQAQGDRISLVLLDLVMPGMGGRETYLQLKSINPRVQVLLSSGYSLNDEAQEIMAQGAQGFIQKPYRIDALSRKIAELLGECNC